FGVPADDPLLRSHVWSFRAAARRSEADSELLSSDSKFGTAGRSLEQRFGILSNAADFRKAIRPSDEALRNPKAFFCARMSSRKIAENFKRPKGFRACFTASISGSRSCREIRKTDVSTSQNK